ncbi:MAG: hypothetical protein KAI89_10515, partial [Emcibacter sp.]|nr:hypothetical protein [Emcibacter sp.]
MIAFLLMAISTVAHAESLVSIKTQQIAPLSSDEVISHFLSVDGQVVALGESHAWVFNEAEDRWQIKGWSTQGKVFGVIGEGKQAFLLLGSEQSGSVTDVAQFLPLTDTANEI